MPVVKLLADRTRGDASFSAGDEYVCSDGEAAALIGLGQAVAVVSKPTNEVAAVAAPETAVTATAAPRKATRKT